MADHAISKISDSDSELKWNIVDVHCDDGLLHRGYIVGAAPGVLVIDFDCEIQEVVYGKIYRSRHRSFFNDNEHLPAAEYRGRLVEVLLRTGRDKPCIWYPGTLLFGDSTKDCSFGVIRVCFPHHTDCIAVPGNRFRTARMEAELQKSMIHEGKLVDRSTVSEIPNREEQARVQLHPTTQPNDHQEVVDRLESVTFRACTVKELNKGVLRGDTRWLVVADIGGGSMYVKNVIVSGTEQKRKKNQSGRPWRKLQKCVCFAGFLADQMFRLSCVLFETYLRIDVYDWEEISLRCLSRNVQSEIFGCLDTMDQVRIRVVCAAWRNTLTSEPVRRVLRYTYSRNEDKTYRREYHLAECLLRCWSEDTHVIAIAGSGTSSMSLIGRYIEDTKQEKQRSAVKTLLLYNLHMENRRNEDSKDFVEDLRRTLSPLASVCSTLVLKNTTMFRPSPILPIVVHFKTARFTVNQLERDKIVNLWDRLDKNCQDIKSSDHSTLAAWIRNFTDLERRKVYSQYRPTDADNIAKILTSIQGNDPREDVQYRLQKWQPDQLFTLDFGKLTKLTACALYAVHHHNSMQVEVCW